MVVRVTQLPEKREECGVLAIYSKNNQNVAPLLYRALIALQHRGQDAAGFAVYDRKTGDIVVKKGVGLVDQIFKPKDLTIDGFFGIGHTRYPTIGKCRICDVQPSKINNIATAHNGHIANYDDIRTALGKQGCRCVSTVDSEPIAYTLDRNSNREAAVREIMETFEGSFSDVAIVDGKLMVFRDRRAMRPLVWGENDKYIAFASETVALDINDIPYKGEVRGGELIVVGGDGSKTTMVRKQIVPEDKKHCMFEYVYFSRPDSIINNKSVAGVRRRLGMELAAESPIKADVVVPIPDTSRTAAAAYAEALGIRFDEGLIKNRYIGRTFIMPSQEKRVDAVRLKLNPVREILQGKSIVLVDDSIVRGTTLREIVALVKSAGAKEVHLRITCPPVIAPCFYGVDMSTYNELIANKKSVDEITEYLGANSLAYISLDGLKRAIELPLCIACLSGEYHSEYVRKLAEKAKKNDGMRKHGCC